MKKTALDSQVPNTQLNLLAVDSTHNTTPNQFLMTTVTSDERLTTDITLEIQQNV
jgi:hypothetical protein